MQESPFLKWEADILPEGKTCGISKRSHFPCPSPLSVISKSRKERDFLGFLLPFAGHIFWSWRSQYVYSGASSCVRWRLMPTSKEAFRVVENMRMCRGTELFVNMRWIQAPLYGGHRFRYHYISSMINLCSSLNKHAAHPHTLTDTETHLVYLLRIAVANT